jgi:AcrR family transcriptional regulator
MALAKQPDSGVPGRRAPLNRERVLRAAVALADGAGVESLTMRRLAKELGVEAMSLYNHVANKEDLLDGMVDLVFGEIEVPATDVDWRTAMRRRAISARAALARHRWAIGPMESRTVPGPENLRLHDAVLGCLREAGFSLEMTIHASSALDAYIYGFALQERSLAFESVEQSAAVAQRKAQQLVSGTFADEFPYLVEVVAGHDPNTGYDSASEFVFGLDLILDGLERLRGTA